MNILLIFKILSRFLHYHHIFLHFHGILFHVYQHIFHHMNILHFKILNKLLVVFHHHVKIYIYPHLPPHNHIILCLKTRYRGVFAYIHIKICGFLLHINNRCLLFNLHQILHLLRYLISNLFNLQHFYLLHLLII